MFSFGGLTGKTLNFKQWCFLDHSKVKLPEQVLTMLFWLTRIIYFFIKGHPKPIDDSEKSIDIP